MRREDCQKGYLRDTNLVLSHGFQRSVREHLQAFAEGSQAASLVRGEILRLQRLREFRFLPRTFLYFFEQSNRDRTVSRVDTFHSEVIPRYTLRVQERILFGRMSHRNLHRLMVNIWVILKKRKCALRRKLRASCTPGVLCPTSFAVTQSEE